MILNKKTPIQFLMRIPSPIEIRSSLPLSQEGQCFVSQAKSNAIDILSSKTHKIAILAGPCSIHDPEVAFEYATRVQALSKKVKNISLFMRLFFEKPRTRSGWKGFIYDPRLNGSHDFSYGLHRARKLAMDIVSLGVGCATELLDPLTVPYLEDLFAWGMIGARTSASQPHRQLASGLSFPVGFKNGIDGELESSIYGILSARDRHVHLSVDEEGYICAKQTEGNPFTHLVLRGSDRGTNYDAESIARALRALQVNHIEPKIMIDCSHGNSKKDPKLQSVVFKSVVSQMCEGNQSILGLMLESHLFPGKQILGDNPKDLRYGVSITDACIGWEETESLILWADEMLSLRPIDLFRI